MSEENKVEEQVESKGTDGVQLNGIYAFKKGMSSIYDDDGVIVPVTVLSLEPWVVTQLKTNENEGYEAVQISCRSQKAKNASKALAKHMKPAGFENGAKVTREIRQALPEGIKVGDKVSLDSLAKGDTVRMTGNSKGRGFAGVVKRWNFAGGPATHGSGFHRRPGSIGNRTWPGRVMPGRKMAGHYGDEKITVKNVQIVDVIKDENVVLVKGAVPGATNSMIKLMKV